MWTCEGARGKEQEKRRLPDSEPGAKRTTSVKTLSWELNLIEKAIKNWKSRKVKKKRKKKEKKRNGPAMLAECECPSQK